MISRMYEVDESKQSYKFLIDEDHKRIQLFKKVDGRLVPLRVWLFSKLTNEMMHKDDD